MSRSCSASLEHSTGSVCPAEASPRRPARRRVWTVLLVGGLLTGLGAGLASYRHHLFPKRFGVVEPGQIFRSGQISRFLIERTLREHHVQIVIDLTTFHPDLPDQVAERDAIARLGIESIRCPLIGDGTGDPAEYERALKSLIAAQRAGRPVLVHCAAGSQRTGGVIAAYRLLVQRRPPTEVLREMQDFGWIPGSDERLRTYLNRHLADFAQHLVADGTLRELPPPEFWQLP